MTPMANRAILLMRPMWVFGHGLIIDSRDCTIRQSNGRVLDFGFDYLLIDRELNGDTVIVDMDSNTIFRCKFADK